MKKPLVPLTALVIGIAAALAAYNLMNSFGVRSLPVGSLIAIGEIQSVKGEVQRRLPENVEIETIHGPGVLHSQEMIFTQRDSQAVVSFKNGTTLRLTENSRFVAEVDASKKDAVIATLLDGSFNVLNTGTPGLFRLYQKGHEITLTTNDEKPLVAMIPATNLPANGSEPQRKIGPGAEPGLVISATQAEEPTPGASSSVATTDSSSGTEATSDVLTNDDIIRQLRGQMGFFQRCYLTFLHRTQELSGSSHAAPSAAATTDGEHSIGPTGTIVASFRILPSGKVGEAKIARSDFKDAVLNRCVTEVIERTQFKAFNGVAIPVQEFPITLH